MNAHISLAWNTADAWPMPGDENATKCEKNVKYSDVYTVGSWHWHGRCDIWMKLTFETDGIMKQVVPLGTFTVVMLSNLF